MATKSGWNSLSPQQQANFKAKNFNMKVKVTESQLDKLRAQGTPTKAIAKYKNDASMREALNRFYGKDRVAKAIGSTTPKKTTPKKTTPKVTTPKVTPPKKKTTGTPVVRGSQRTNATRGSFGAPNQIQRKTRQVQSAMERGKTKEGQDKSAQMLGNALTIASFLPFVGPGARVVKYGMMARKLGITVKEAKAVAAAAKLTKAGKPLGIASGKTKAGDAARHVKPKTTAARRTKPTVRSTVKDAAGVVKRNGGTHAKPKATPRHAAPRTGTGITRITKPIVKKAVSKGRHAKPSGRRG